jgi:hypothetical protein
MRSGMSTAAAELDAVIGGLQGVRKRQRARLELGSPHVAWDVEAELERALARNADTWKALERLGVRTGEGGRWTSTSRAQGRLPTAASSTSSASSSDRRRKPTATVSAAGYRRAP